MRRSNHRPSPLKLGTKQYGTLDPRVAFTTAFAPYFAKVVLLIEKQAEQSQLQKKEGSG